MTKRPLTDKQKTFLELLFSDAIKGDFVKAKVEAGYSPDYATSSIIKGLEEEILSATRSYLARSGPKAAIALTDAIYNPTQLGIRDKLNAAKDILDRIGVIKTERVEVNGNGIFILPSKDRSSTEEEE